MQLLVTLLLVSGPIRQKLWMAHAALAAALLICGSVWYWLSRPGAVERVSWAFPLRGPWLRRLLEGVVFFSGLFALYLLITSGLGFFTFFPWLAK